MNGTTITTRPAATCISRRNRAEAAFTAAYARRGGDMRVVGPWLLGYLETVTRPPMSDHDIAETVRGIAEAWRRLGAEIEADLDATISAMTGQPS